MHIMIVVDDVIAEEKWWRGCKMDLNKTMGCSQHKFVHDNHEFLVDECVCSTELCNKEMGPLPETTSTPKTSTTTSGTRNTTVNLQYQILTIYYKVV